MNIRVEKAPINMRVALSQHALLNKAASILNVDRTTFILDAACKEAQNVLLDQRLFNLNDEQFKAFESALDRPVAENKKLKALLSEHSPWE